MSQVRESLNPGLPEEDLLRCSDDGERSREHVQPGETVSADNASRRSQRCQNSPGRGRQVIVTVSKNEDEGTTGGGHDSDPPIENQNPEDGEFHEISMHIKKICM